MKKIMSILLITVIGCLGYAGMVTNKPSGIFTVSNDCFKISFFPRHMLPYEIDIDGRKFKPVFLDRLYDKSSKKDYLLAKDRWCDIKVVKNDGQTVVVKASGKYCFSNTVAAPGNAGAVYTYTIRKNSPVIDIKGVITKNDNKDWDQLWFMQPGFKRNPFKTVITERLEQGEDLASVPKRTKYSSEDWGVFADDKVAIGIGGKRVSLWYDMNKTYYTYLTRGMVSHWSRNKVEMSCKIYLGRKQNKNFYRKVLGNPAASEKRGKDFCFTLKSGDYQVVMGPKNTTIRKIIYQGVVLGTATGWYGTIFAPERVQFIGAGHNEGGVEKVELVNVTVDGKKQQLKANKVFSGNSVEFKKISMLGHLRVHMTLTVGNDEIKMSKHFEAVADQKAYSMYIYQFCWSNKMTNYVARLDDGKVATGTTTKSNEKFLFNKQRIKFLAQYSKLLEKGEITFFDEVYTTQKQTIWDRKVYKKHYMMLKTPKVYKKGYKSPVYNVRIRGFNADGSNLIKTVDKIAAKMSSNI